MHFPLKKAILDLLFPVRCLGCSKEGEFCCGSCRSALRPIPPICFFCKKMVPGSRVITPGRTCSSCRKRSNIYAFLSPFLYGDDTIRELIHALKYRRVRSVGLLLGDLIVEYLKKFKVPLPEGAVLLPIPLHPSRQRTRGFNQAELIALRIGEILHLPVEKSILRKIKKTIPQMELRAEERRKNVVGTFSVADPESTRGKTILLLDDVKTTGATLEEAARVLKKAGAKRVWAMTVAH